MHTFLLKANMTQVWLRTNGRAVAMNMLPPLLVAGLGLTMLLGLAGFESLWLRIVGGFMLAGSAGVIVLLLIFWRRPWLAQRDGELLAYLRSDEPIHLPLEIVEAFCLGQSPALPPGKRERNVRTKNLVIRLAERATDWAEGDVKPALGSWKEGYITIRGLWCEPLTEDLLRRLNQQLYEAKQRLTPA